jgi:hypothetical protein
LLKQRNDINRKIDAEISRISFIAITCLPDPPEGSIIKMAENEQ